MMRIEAGSFFIQTSSYDYDYDKMGIQSVN
jgi:hypothetical protein